MLSFSHQVLYVLVAYLLLLQAGVGDVGVVDGNERGRGRVAFNERVISPRGPRSLGFSGRSRFTRTTENMWDG